MLHWWLPKDARTRATGQQNARRTHQQKTRLDTETNYGSISSGKDSLTSIPTHRSCQPRIGGPWPPESCPPNVRPRVQTGLPRLWQGTPNPNFMGRWVGGRDQIDRLLLEQVSLQLPKVDNRLHNNSGEHRCASAVRIQGCSWPSSSIVACLRSPRDEVTGFET